jgi:hypothetical protein
MTIAKKITSIVFIITIATMFVSSSVFVNSILAKTSTTTTSSKGNIRSAKQDYTSFQKCLSTAAGTKGFATQQEIKNCYNQIYNTSTVSTTSTAVGNGQ